MGKIAKFVMGLFVAVCMSQTFAIAKPSTILTDKNMKAVCANPSKYIGDRVNIEISVWLPVYIARNKLKNTYTAMLGTRVNGPIQTWGIVSDLDKNYLSTGDDVVMTGVIVGKVRLHLTDTTQTYVEIKVTHYKKID